MIKIDIYQEYCLIWFDNFSDEAIKGIISTLDSMGFMYDLHNKSVTVYNPTYQLLHDLSIENYILLQ